MGQKTNPISLRLKTTNKNFDSCWYSDLHYSTVWSLELKAKSYIDKIFEQIRYPKPRVSLSLMPKRAKILMFYLNPERSRGERGERFQLKPFISPRAMERRIHPLTTQPLRVTRTENSPLGASHVFGLNIRNDYPSTGRRDNMGWGSTKLRKGSPYPGGIPDWERKLFVYSTLLSVTKRKSGAGKLLFERDFALFYRVHRLIWFQGRGEGCLSSINRRQSYNYGEAGGRLSRVKNPSGKEAPLSRLRSGLSSNKGRSNPAQPARRLHTLCVLRQAPSLLCLVHQVHNKSLGSMPSHRIPLRNAPDWGNAVTWGKRSFLTGTPNWEARSGDGGFRHKPRTVNMPCLVPAGPSRPSIREIRRQDQHFSIPFMESRLDTGLGLSTTIYPYKSIEEEQTAQFLSEEIAYYLEQRVPFRRIKQTLMHELEKRYIEGIRVSCSGRVGGRSKKAQRAKEERFQWGQTSSHVFSSKLSFASRSALTPFGKVGIKVWICYR